MYDDLPSTVMMEILNEINSNTCSQNIDICKNPDYIELDPVILSNYYKLEFKKTTNCRSKNIFST